MDETSELQLLNEKSKNNIEQYKECLLRRLKRDINNNNLIFSKDEKDFWKIFEIISAYYTDTILWNDVDIRIKEIKNCCYDNGKDVGIDSACDNKAVQAKYRINSETVKWDEIAKFLAVAKISDFPYNELYITTLPNTKLSKIKANEYKQFFITDELISNFKIKLDSVDLKYKYDKFKLRDYQIKALEYMYQDGDEDGEIKIALPCGSGKSHLIIEYIKSQKPNCCGIFVPSLLLLNQFKELLDEYKMKYCLVGTGYNEDIDYESDIFICVYNSAKLLEDIEFDVIFIDEAHHIYRPEIYVDNETIYDDTEEESFKDIINNLNAEKKIYLSATIDDANYKYSMRDAIDNGYLTDYDIHIPAYDDNITNQNIVDLINLHDEYRKILAYCNSVDNAKEISEYLNKHQIISASFDGETPLKQRMKHINDFENENIRILVTVNVLGEGINIPIADTCIFINNRESKINVIQCVGRILRIHPEKTISHIVLPCKNGEQMINKFIKIFADEDFRIKESIKKNKNGRIIMNTFNEKTGESILLDETIYDRFGNIIKDNFDEKYELVKQWIEIHKKLPNMGSKNSNEKKIGIWCNNMRQRKKQGKLIDERIKKLELLDGWYWEQKDPFDDWYNELKQWIGINKKLPSGMAKDPQEKQLGSWCCKQRASKKKGKLSDEKIKKLEELDGWYWEQDLFNDSYDELKQWIIINKKLPSEHSKDLHEKQLGNWCYRKRTDKKKGKLSNEKIKKLELLDGWYWEQDLFNDSYDELKQWIEINKKLPLEYSKDQQEKQLGRWISQKRVYKKKGKLSDEKIKKLELLDGWYWEQKDPFDDWYNELKQWIIINKKLPSENLKDLHEKQLGKWCSHKRKDKKEGKLVDEKIKKLELLDGWFWEQEDPFDDHYAELKQYIEINNKLPSENSKDLHEKQLGNWRANQRKYKKKGKLSDERIKQLELLDGWYWEQDLFNDSYDELKQWIIINKKLPSENSKDLHEKQLGNWCSHKRKDKKEGKLVDEKINKLELFEGWYWEQKDPFNDHYDELKQWIEIHKKIPSGMVKDPQEKQLGSWCCKQRASKKKGKLSDEKIKKLEELDGWYWEQDLFNDSYDELKQWIIINKKLPSENSKDLHEKQLGNWCSNKRRDKKKGKLSDVKIKKLELLDEWYWTDENINKVIESFDDSYDELKQWIEINKKLPSSTSKNQQEKQFGIWCCTQRRNQRKGKLSDERIKKLKLLDGWYWKQEDLFDDSYDELEQWIKINKKLPNKRSNNQEEKQIGIWCSYQRQNKKKGKLSDAKIKKIEKLPFWYWSK